MQKKILNDISYFRLVKAYSINLKPKNGNYDNKTTFKEIVNLYLFNADMVARYRFISKGENIDGFYGGNSFANQIGITTQVPRVVEIVSNNTNSSDREVRIGREDIGLICFFIPKKQN